MVKKGSEGSRAWLKLLLIFLAAAAVRAILALLCREGPLVVIDEGLYTNIARSIAFEGRVAFRGQPVSYPYLLYSLLLVPVYRLNAVLGGPIYRYVQVFNALLFSASVFPAYALGKRFTDREGSGLTAAALTALLPDGILTAFTMSESLLWPLILAGAYFAFRFLAEGEKRSAVFAGLLTGLAWFVKPGAVVPVGAILLGTLLFRKDRRRNIVYALAALLGCAAVGYGVSFALSGRFTLIGLYTKQTSDWTASHALIALGSTVYMSVFLAAAMGGTFLLIPFAYLKAYDRDRRDMVIYTAAGTLAVLIGTAVFVTPYRWRGDLLFLRYITPCMPLFIIFTLGAENSRRPLGKAYTRLMLVFLPLLLAAGIDTVLSGRITDAVHNFAAGAFIQNSSFDGRATGLILTVLLSIYVLFEAMSGGKTRFTGSIKTAMTVVFCIVLLFGNVCGYLAASVPLPEGVSEDACELNRMLGGTKALGVTQQMYDDYRSYWQEGSLTYPMQQVTFDQMAVEMADTAGVYEPFVPLDQAPNTGNGLTPETDTLVLGQTVREHLELSDSVSAETTANGIYSVVTLAEGQRWVDTMLYGLDGDSLAAGSEAMLLVYGGREGSMELTLSVQASAGDAVITVTQAGNVQERTVSGTERVSFALDAAAATVAASGDLLITGYTTAQ